MSWQQRRDDRAVINTRSDLATGGRVFFDGFMLELISKQRYKANLIQKR